MGLKRNPFCRSADTVSSWILFASFCVRSRDEAAPCWRLTNGELAKGLADHCGGHLWCRRSEKKKNEKNNKNQQQTNVFRCVCWIANWNSLLFLRSFVRLFVALWGSFPWSRLPISVHFVIAASPFSRVLLGFFLFCFFYQSPLVSPVSSLRPTKDRFGYHLPFAPVVRFYLFLLFSHFLMIITVPLPGTRWIFA